MSAEVVDGTYRIARVRYQDAGGRGAILVGERLDAQGRADGRATLRVPGGLSHGARPFHVAQTLRLRGQAAPWRDPRTGAEERQLVVGEWVEVRPRGAAWIDYVASGPAFAGIGRSTARTVWDRLGDDVFRLLAAKDPTALAAAVPGLGEERARILTEAWAASGQEELVRWLDEHALPRRLCGALLRAYAGQDAAVARLSADPYRLLAFGVGWAQVDCVARTSFAVPEDDPRRLHAAVVEVLMGEYARGHTAADAATLSAGVAGLLGAGDWSAAKALRLVFADGGFVRSGPDLFQLRGVHAMERAIAADLARRCAAAAEPRLDLGRDKALDGYQEGSGAGIRLTDRQRAGVRDAVDLPLSVIVGGAGTGKTACLAALHHVAEELHGRRDAVLQMALAGKAAKRLREATGREAVTIAGFLHTVDEERIARASHVVIDEASMLDVPGFHAVLRRLRGRANMVLVGDDAQLPPIGGGKILHLLPHREGVPVTALDRVWRQEEGNSILSVAAAVRVGDVPALPPFAGQADGVSLAHPGDDTAGTARLLFDLLGGPDPGSDTTVITPRRRSGPGNALAINQAIHVAHFADGAHVVGPAGDTGFCVGDRLVSDANHWDVDLMNGSLGRILRLATREEAEDAQRDGGTPTAVVEVDGEERLLDDRHLLGCGWGYALTCHRAQGSDFGRVVVILDDRTDRSWLYTAITRGRRQVVLVGTAAQVARIAATPPRVEGRRVGLDSMLLGAMGPSGEGVDGRR